MAATVVGLDFGARAVRGVEVSGCDGPRPVVVRAHEVPLPEGAVQRAEVVEVGTVSTALKRLWATGGFRSKDVVLGVGGPRLFAREVTVPRAPLGQIRESLPFHVQDQLPVPVSDAFLDFYPIAEAPPSEAGPAVSGLLVAALKEMVNANVSAVADAGLRPIHVDAIPLALTRALAPRRSARGRIVLVDIGATTTNIVVVHDGVPEFVRILTGGGDDLTRAISQRLDVPPAEAEQLQRRTGMHPTSVGPDDRAVVEVVYQVVGELLSTIRATLSYHANAKPAAPVQQLVLVGGLSALPGLPAAAGEVLGLPVARGEVFGQIAVAKRSSRVTDETREHYTTALGLALGSHA